MNVIIKIIRIVDGNKVEVSNEVPPFRDGSKKDIVEKELAEVYGAGFLLQNGEAITDENLPGGEHEYQLIMTQPIQQSK
jgi:hypothetical protein